MVEVVDHSDLISLLLNGETGAIVAAKKDGPAVMYDLLYADAFVADLF